jgi:hypothetical protein
MKKILAAIVEYKLNKNNLPQLVQKINTEINTKNIMYPDAFRSKIFELIQEIHSIAYQDILSLRDEECVMDTLKEMEHLIVDYLSKSSASQN